MLAQVLQILWGKEHLVKNWLISTLDKVITSKEQIFQRSAKPLFTSQMAENLPFFKHASSSVASKISMVRTRLQTANLTCLKRLFSQTKKNRSEFRRTEEANILAGKSTLYVREYRG
jgi:hypothetical protein